MTIVRPDCNKKMTAKIPFHDSAGATESTPIIAKFTNSKNLDKDQFYQYHTNTCKELENNSNLIRTPTYTTNKDTLLYPYIPTEYLDRLYPTNVPRSIQLLRKENLAIPACYLCVGLMQGQ